MRDRAWSWKSEVVFLNEQIKRDDVYMPISLSIKEISDPTSSEAGYSSIGPDFLVGIFGG